MPGGTVIAAYFLTLTMEERHAARRMVSSDGLIA
jgi:hypothetical protein